MGTLTVKTQMKCNIMLHFIMVCAVGKIKTTFRDRNTSYSNLEKNLHVTP